MRKVAIFVDHLGHLVHADRDSHHCLEPSLDFGEIFLAGSEQRRYAGSCGHDSGKSLDHFGRCTDVLLVVGEDLSLLGNVAVSILKGPQLAHFSVVFVRTLDHARHLLLQFADLRPHRLGGLFIPTLNRFEFRKGFFLVFDLLF